MTIFGGQWIAATVAASDTTSDAINLGMDYEYVNIIIPELDSATIVLQVGVDPTNSGTISYQTLGVGDTATAATTGERTTTLELGGFQYIKIVCSVAQDGGARTFYVRGYRG